MAYILLSDLVTRFGAEELAQVSDRALPRLVDSALLSLVASGGDTSGYSAEALAAAAVSAGNIGQSIADAESAIDGYLSSRYLTPLAPVPDIVKRLACDVARYYLYDDHATETVQKRYDAAIAFFRDVSAGKVSLGAEVQSSGVASTGGGSVEMVTAGRVFSRSARGL